jgi:pyruvate dehydrogenase E2 component (dihydrolipoamide acetyltransferase)
MARELTMPKLSDSMADAVITRWLKEPGDAFARGDALIEVETDKATVVYEAEWDGTLGAILVPEGGTAGVGEAIATLSNGDGTAAPPPAPVATTVPAPAAASDDGGQVPAPTAAAGSRANASPVARRVAVELGVSLHGIEGTGPGGRVTVEDVRAVADAGAPDATRREAAGKGEVASRELTPTETTIARRMTESATTTPVLTAAADIDVSLIVALRRGAREAGEATPSLNDFVVKAAARTLREQPRLNASYADGRIETYSRVNVGIAVATEDDALLVPVVLDADRKTLAEIAADTRRLADAARRRALTPEQLHHATFTVSNLGMFGVRSFTAIVDPPQVAILAVGGARREAFEDGAGRVSFRDVITVTLTCDHRVVYGAHAAQFLSRLCELLEQPLALTL